ncbi:MAG TPA: hypothetical protein VNM69_16180 [Bacillus sp. (in: firmicutes)]|uniref:hypothetical protein n=1 Tax=Bacillus litorisediminis TaxID=2922713 RepID=UPI001FAC5B23|nr:hypothetical protein [Bacillus litorisediminis]HWO77404.1 hypothetical protein [Bacillus sp. (in: firmicutes)]
MIKLKDFNQFKWIQEEKESIDFENWKGCKVSNLLPARYNHYCKIMHPIYLDSTIKDESLLWSQCNPDEPVQFVFGERLTLKELAEKYKLHYTKEISTWTISHLLGGIPRYLFIPEEGSIDEKTLRELVSVLKPFTKGIQCYFQYHLLKIVHSFPGKIENGQLYYGKLEDVFQLYEMGDGRRFGSPSYWWAEDKSWCLHTDFDSDFSLLGGSKEIVEALLSNYELECIEVDVSTRVDNKADKKNLHF